MECQTTPDHDEGNTDGLDLHALFLDLAHMGHDAGPDTIAFIHAKLRERGADAYIATCQVSGRAIAQDDKAPYQFKGDYLSLNGKLYDAGGEISREDCEQVILEHLMEAYLNARIPPNGVDVSWEKRPDAREPAVSPFPENGPEIEAIAKAFAQY